ncbi:DUF2691 family protein [Paenibacillus athensensis]|uniref:DUF2691 domain-containing protein n=1 Tax=Paenibacillus athensensis TaxID=1967502 RepID=A0A4Y8Q2T1_9BACL|nr:DUF2691 family protein [Paenibacillus athensensis]MCD1261412.1 DUF2691 family protein [Paenibacillus athensensis]
MRGISFEIPNEYGKWLFDVLKPFDCKDYNWLVGAGEEYKWQENDLKPLFADDVDILEGEDLLQIIDSEEPQYIIFADLKAFPIGKQISQIDKYEDFLESDCELILLIVDSTYTSIYCKDVEVLNLLYANAKMIKVDSLAYITDDNDFRKTLKAR